MQHELWLQANEGQELRSAWELQELLRS